MAKKETRQEKPDLRNAKERAVAKASALGHRIGAWREVYGGLRGACMNPHCQAHLYLRLGGLDYGEASSPTSLKMSCPYILRDARIKGRQALKRA